MSDYNFDDFLDALNPNDFDEKPASPEDFLYGPEYMGKYLKANRLSPMQMEIFKRGSVIYRYDTLVDAFGVKMANELWEMKVKNILLMLGKGSGKDFTSRLSVLYVVHQLLCLRSPQEYYEIGSTDPIEIVNLALNSDQARTVFFEPLVSALKTSPWFAGKFKALAKDVEFDKNVNVYSLHSDPEAAEGKNVLIAILDEIDGFTVEGWSDHVYKYLSGAVTSRFPKYGKVVCLSFPRTKDGFIMRKYRDVVRDVDVENFTHEFYKNESLGDIPENTFTVSWTEDTVLNYEQDNFWALKAPTFRVNPNRSIEDYKDDFFNDIQNNDADTLMRVCANPPDHDSTSFFTNHEKIEETFNNPNGWFQENSNSIGELKIKADPRAEYYIHVDLSKVSDRTVVGLAHVSNWIDPDSGSKFHTEPMPYITVDLFRVWEPSRLKPVDDAEVMDFIILLCKKFNVRLVTFDQWNSFDNIRYLESLGIDAVKSSLKREEYLEFRTAMMEDRMSGPYDERLWKELKNLIIVQTGNGGKVDHPKGKEHFNDISEAVCGATVNAIRNTSRSSDLEVLDIEDLTDDFDQDIIEDKPVMPGYIKDWMDSWEAL